MPRRKKGSQDEPSTGESSIFWKTYAIGPFTLDSRARSGRHLIHFAIVFCLLATPWFLVSSSMDEVVFETAVQSSEQKHPNEHTKYILYFNKYWFKPDFQFGVGRQPFVDYGCPVDNCWAQPLEHNNSTLFNDRNKSQYDAVLVSVQNSDMFTLDNETRFDISQWRQPNQRFVFFIMESQAFHINFLKGMNGFFNWTMTFKWNSDIVRPYGWFQEKVGNPSTSSTFYANQPSEWIEYNEAEFLASLPSRDDTFHALAGRPGKVAWIVSHCDTDSSREDYVFHLRRYMQVDEFGSCRHGAPSCDIPYSITAVDNCTREVEQNYKFYLAFENQFCNDYVTEKFFRRMENAVVITLGQANYSEIAPPHSSINVFDFDSVEALATYIQELDQDDAKYLSYFWWKDHYTVRHTFTGTEFNNFGQSMCQLCEKLHNADEPVKAYDDIHGWWRTEAECGKRLLGLRARMAAGQSLPGIRQSAAAWNSNARLHLPR